MVRIDCSRDICPLIVIAEAEEPITQQYVQEVSGRLFFLLRESPLGLGPVLGRRQAGPHRVLPRNGARADTVRLPVGLPPFLRPTALQGPSKLLVLLLLTYTVQ